MKLQPHRRPMYFLIAKSVWRKFMREPGLEPGSLAAPDPKAHSAPDNTPAAEPNLAPAATEIPPDATPGTTRIATCGAQRGNCRCGLRKLHVGLHECGECGDQYVADTDDYCDSCGKLCFGEKGTAEEPIRQNDGSIKCGECVEEDDS